MPVNARRDPGFRRVDSGRLFARTGMTDGKAWSAEDQDGFQLSLE
jgi:hypothetical protein